MSDLIFSRTARLLGEAAMERLAAARVAVFGLGGVGGHAAEALVRSGIGAIDLIDNDTVAPSNLNRQIFATADVLGLPKTEAARRRLVQINPHCQITLHQTFFLPETAGQFDFGQYNYIVDAIDTVTGKIELVLQAGRAGVPILSAMGTGNKLDPTQLEVADIYDTSVCPLARVMRRELKKRGVPGLQVVYSRETPISPYKDAPASDLSAFRRQTPGSTAFVPSVAGLIMAGVIVRALAADPSKSDT